MKARVYHLQINVSDKNISFPFYKELLEYLDYKVISSGKSWLGMSNSTTDFWIIPAPAKHQTPRFHRKRTGLNHIAFMVSSKNDVEKFANEFVKPKKIPTLYNSPKLFPEYTPDYYAVFFEDPDRIKLEVCYHK